MKRRDNKSSWENLLIVLKTIVVTAVIFLFLLMVVYREQLKNCVKYCQFCHPTFDELNKICHDLSACVCDRKGRIEWYEPYIKTDAAKKHSFEFLNHIRYRKATAIEHTEITDTTATEPGTSTDIIIYKYKEEGKVVLNDLVLGKPQADGLRCYYNVTAARIGVTHHCGRVVLTYTSWFVLLLLLFDVIHVTATCYVIFLHYLQV